MTGVIVDASGEPLIGVSVVEKGNKTNGAVTDIDGKFVINVPANSSLVVSYVGYKTQEVAVAGKHNINVTLKEDAEMLNDVVVIGYGVVKKADLALLPLWTTRLLRISLLHRLQTLLTDVWLV